MLVRDDRTSKKVVRPDEVVVKDLNQQIGRFAFGRRMRRHRKFKNGIPARVQGRVTDLRLGDLFPLVLDLAVGVGSPSKYAGHAPVRRSYIMGPSNP